MTNLQYRALTFLFVALACLNIKGQYFIQGGVKDKEQYPIEMAFVGVYDVRDTLNMLGYVYSHADGAFNLEVPVCGEYLLCVKSMVHKPYKKTLNLSDTECKSSIDVTLEVKSFVINEVKAIAPIPIIAKEDTIVFNAQFFSDGTESSVEDLLRNLPGINVGSDGAIRVGNQEIEKIMVDGDDFFEKAYKILSKNMPAYPIEEVELLKKYSNNRLLKGIEESNKLALNLKLYEKSKRIWFGNINAGAGNQNFHNIKANLMNYGKKNKYYLLTNFNNIGYDATGDLELLINPLYTSESASIGDVQSAHHLISLPEIHLNFEKSRTAFNNDKLFSPNVIFNPSEKLKVKILGVINRKENEFLRLMTQHVNVGEVKFTNNENYQIHKKRELAFGKMDLHYQLSSKTELKTHTKYNSNCSSGNNNLMYNSVKTNEALIGKGDFFDQKIDLTHKISDKQVVLFTGRYKYEWLSQSYYFDNFFYEDLFPEIENADEVRQSSCNVMQYGGLSAHYIHRYQNSNLFELQVANEYRRDKLNTTFVILDEDLNLYHPDGFQNYLVQEFNNLYLRTKYLYQIKQLSVIGRFQLQCLTTVLGGNLHTKVIVNPAFDFQWKINAKNKMNFSYSFSKSNSDISDVFNQFVMTDYRSFMKGTGETNYLGASKVLFNYELGNWTDRFFANAFFIYIKNHDFFSTNSIVQPDYTLAKKTVLKNREMFSATVRFDYYMRPILNNLKLDLAFSSNEFKNAVNEIGERLVLSLNYHLGLELRSAFKGRVNYHLGTKWITNSIQTSQKRNYMDNVSYVDLKYTFNQRANLKFEFERYEFGNFHADKEYYFCDLTAGYNLIQDKLFLGFDLRNIFDTRWYKSYAISDISSSVIRYKLLPRHFLIRLEYRF